MSASTIHASGDIPSPRGSTAIVSIDGLVLCNEKDLKRHVTNMMTIVFGGEPINSGEVWDPQLYILHTRK